MTPAAIAAATPRTRASTDVTWEQLASHPSVKRLGQGWLEGRWKRHKFVVRQEKLGDRLLFILELILCRAGELDPARLGSTMVGMPAIAQGWWILRHAVLADGLDGIGLEAYWDALSAGAEELRRRRPASPVARLFSHFAG
jgi:hypothetical protein